MFNIESSRGVRLHKNKNPLKTDTKSRPIKRLRLDESKQKTPESFRQDSEIPETEIPETEMPIKIISLDSFDQIQETKIINKISSVLKATETEEIRKTVESVKILSMSENDFPKASIIDTDFKKVAIETKKIISFYTIEEIENAKTNERIYCPCDFDYKCFGILKQDTILVVCKNQYPNKLNYSGRPVLHCHVLQIRKIPNDETAKCTCGLIMGTTVTYEDLASDFCCSCEKKTLNPGDEPCVIM